MPKKSFFSRIKKGLNGTFGVFSLNDEENDKSITIVTERTSASERSTKARSPEATVTHSEYAIVLPSKLSGEKLVLTKREKKKLAVKKWVTETYEKGVDGIMKEYLEFQNISSTLTLFGKPDDERNRYRDIGCIDKSRVRLKQVDASCDYINANFIDSYKQKRRFICTQAPLNWTVEDFWLMISQNKCDYIIMLCDLVEHNMSVCAEYWPRKHGERSQFNDFEIKNCHASTIKVKEHNIPFTAFKSKLSVCSRFGAHNCTHIFWPQWPDGESPPSVLMAERIAREVRQSKHPITMHCTTGIGRSATLIAVELILEIINAGELCDMNEFFTNLREQRTMAVNTMNQYISIYEQVMLYFQRRNRIQSSDKKNVKLFLEKCRNILQKQTI